MAVLHNLQPLMKQLKLLRNYKHKEKNYSIGLGQINKHNFNRFTHDYKTFFDPCENLNATQVILS